MSLQKKKPTQRHQKPIKIKEPLPKGSPPSQKYPDGYTTTRRQHCSANPSGRDHLYPEKIAEIANQHFSELTAMPCPNTPNKRGEKNEYRGQFDSLIAGWTQYWNDIFSPDEKLDPNLVKALIFTESRFNPLILAKWTNKNSARGLVQITNSTREIMGDSDGELTDHYITVTREELNDPNTNICAVLLPYSAPGSRVPGFAIKNI